jgi:signal transduction histidine kinase
VKMGRLLRLALHGIGWVFAVVPEISGNGGWQLAFFVPAMLVWIGLVVGGERIPSSARQLAWGVALVLGAAATGLGSVGGIVVTEVALLIIVSIGTAFIPAAVVWIAAGAVAFGATWELDGAPASTGWSILIGALLAGGLGLLLREKSAERRIAELDLERRVDTAVAGERARIARDIHDVLAHSLGGLTIQLDALEVVAEKQRAGDDVIERIRRARQLAADGLVEARNAVDALRAFPDRVDEAITEVVRRARGAGQRVTLSMSGDPRRLTAPLSSVLASIAVEALTNAREHAPGVQASVDLLVEPRQATLVVINETAATTLGSGHGIRGMRERAELIGATLQAAGEDGTWIVKCVAPR